MPKIQQNWEQYSFENPGNLTLLQRKCQKLLPKQEHKLQPDTEKLIKMGT